MASELVLKHASNLHKNCTKRQPLQLFIASSPLSDIRNFVQIEREVKQNPKYSSFHNLKAIKLIKAFPLPSKPDRTIDIGIVIPCEECRQTVPTSERFHRVCIVLHSPGNIVARCGGCDLPRYRLGLSLVVNSSQAIKTLKEAWEEVRRSPDKLGEFFEVWGFCSFYSLSRSRMEKGNLNFPSPSRSRAQTFCTPSHARARNAQNSNLTKLNKGGAA